MEEKGEKIRRGGTGRAHRQQKEKEERGGAPPHNQSEQASAASSTAEGAPRCAPGFIDCRSLPFPSEPEANTIIGLFFRGADKCFHVTDMLIFQIINLKKSDIFK